MNNNNLDGYSFQVMNERTHEVLKDYSPVVLQDELFDQFVDACENASGPNEALRLAVSDTRERGFHTYEAAD